MTELNPFHLAVPVTDLDSAREFYCELLGFETGRTASRWIDLNFYGHQVTLHLVDEADSDIARNPVDGDNVPAAIAGKPRWERLVRNIPQRKQTTVVGLGPRQHVRGPKLAFHTWLRLSQNNVDTG